MGWLITDREELPKTYAEFDKLEREDIVEMLQKKADSIYEENEKKNPNAVSCRIMICALVGFIIYILCILFEQVLDFPYSREVYFIISGICQSLLAAAVLAIVIDIPSKLEDYKSSIIEALSSDSYLKMLEESKLTLLRKKVTEQLNKMSAPNMPKGLIEKDQWICELLRKPYYSRYRHFVSCSDIDGDDNFILKKHNINYKLINPYGKHKEMTEHIKVTNLVYLHDFSEESINDMKISCTIDGGTKKEYIDFVRTLPEKQSIELNGLKIDLCHGSPRNQNENIFTVMEIFGVN